ncbi:hypothetical protein TrLO_g15947 [Triparma laevis f. longispina]|uniref:Cullin family profile domain-containing protein n=1 Tax=Triparma laevis f. longispina TaxID=1714387 RepID=A0A9W7DWZ0_9STRA|nr:hypothetical protein TrLO_g15947 [Triparma laevis f. longispina]
MKLKIKGFTKPPTLPTDFYTSTESTLLKASESLLLQLPITETRESLYKGVEDLCIHKHSPKLFTSLKTLLQTHCTLTLLPKIKTFLLSSNFTIISLQTPSPTPKLFLTLLGKVWNDWLGSLGDLKSIYLYLDRSYCLTNVGVPMIIDLGVNLFLTEVLEKENILDLVIKSLIQLGKNRWEGEDVDVDLLRGGRGMLSALELYGRRFMREYVGVMKGFFKLEGEEKARTLPLKDYLTHCTSRFTETSTIALRYLESSSKGDITSLLEEQLLKPHVGHLLSQLKSIIEDRSCLKELYTYILRVNELPQLSKTLNEWIKSSAVDIISSEKGAHEQVTELIEYRGEVDGIWRECFGEEEFFKGGIKGAFEEAINQDGRENADRMAKFVDKLMKEKKNSEGDLEKTRFEEYYDNKYQGRRIEWRHSQYQATVDFRVSGSNKKYMLEVDCYQALVLKCFNEDTDNTGLTVEAIAQQTGLTFEELKSVLNSLAFGKPSKNGSTRVLKPVQKAPTDDNNKPIISPTQLFAVNFDFKNKQMKVRIQNISSKKEEEQKQSSEALVAVDKDRLILIDACCIRIMKSRKTMKHADLVSEIMGQLKFKAENKSIKERIESLIEREYLERGEERSTYNYLA